MLETIASVMQQLELLELSYVLTRERKEGRRQKGERKGNMKEQVQEGKRE